MANTNISAKTTHDLWVEAREYTIDIDRPSSTTVRLTITRPLSHTTADGAVVLLSTKPIGTHNYPSDGTQFTPSTDLTAPADLIQEAQVVGFYSTILNIPFPVGTVDTSTNVSTFEIIISNTAASALYYASIHPCSNVLQYYPLGILSYPLEGSRIEKGAGTFTGSIPTLPETPTDPTVGMVYHDQQLNLVQYWTGTAWIPTRVDSILSGPTNPGVLGQAYLYAGSTLRVFSGTKWIRADNTNLQFKVGSTWVPLNSVVGTPSHPTAAVAGDLIWNFSTQRAEYFDGADWQIPSSANTLFNTGSTWIPAFVSPATYEPDELPTPYIGQLFYNTRTKSLDAWTGTSWRKANTDQEGTVITDKTPIGSDGSYDERIRLINVLKAQLGWPVSCVELKEEQFNIGIDNALDNYRMWSDGAYKMSYIMFQLIPNQQTYYLNDPTNKTDRIVDVTKVHRLNMLGVQAITGSDAIWSQGILGSYYNAAVVDTLSLHLLHSLSEDFTRMFAGDLTFLWDEASRELFFTRRISNAEKVIIECHLEKTEQEILVDRWSKQFIQNWALAECKYQLGMIRSKFSSGTPGAAGTINLNGELLITEARQDMTELKEECLNNYEFGGHVGGGNVSFLVG